MDTDVNFKGKAFPLRLQCAWQGISQAWHNEASFRTQTLFAMLTLASLFFLRPPLVWCALVAVMVCLVLALELVNTALEHALDGLHPESAEFVRMVKDCAAGAVLLAGNYLCVVALLHLGRSISIMAEARKLVTGGPYAVVRHPLYLAEQIAIVGVFLQFLSWQAALILLLHFVFQVRRMINEERVLADSFAEYGDYAERTSRLIPGIW
jgi:diacylglycerol kinase